jgi:hypothetical protein
LKEARTSTSYKGDMIMAKSKKAGGPGKMTASGKNAKSNGGYGTGKKTTTAANRDGMGKPGGLPAKKGKKVGPGKG